MKLRYTPEALCDLQEIKRYIKSELHNPTAASRITKAILDGCAQLKQFPEMGVLKYDTLMGKYGFRALFIDKYVCVYKIEGDTVRIYHLADARKNYIYHIFGME